MKNTTLLILIVILLFSFGFSLFIPETTPVAQATTLWDMQEGHEEIPEAYGYSTGQTPRDLRSVVVRVIRIFLSFIALIFVIIIIFAGWKWMTSVGNQDKVAEAKRQIVAGVLGFAIVAAAYAITYFVVYILERQVFNTI